MSARAAPPWTAAERAILDDVYPREGIGGAVDALPDRSWHAIQQMAHKRGLRSPIFADAPSPVLGGDKLEEAIRLREESGWSFARIGATLGCSEASACNAVLIALCPRKGYRPAERDATGRLLPEGKERLRYALRKGLKGVDIQLRLGLSAGRIAEERRRYSAELRASGKAPLPRAGAGTAYSGAKLIRSQIVEVERLLLDGFGAQKIAERTGVSMTSVGRIRNRLIARLARKGEVLPGCDATGKRRTARESLRRVPEESERLFRHQLLERVPVKRAAHSLGIGLSAAYRIRDALAAELTAAGSALPPPIRPGRCPDARAKARAADWLPTAKLQRHRDLVHRFGQDEAKRLMLQELADERAAVRAEAARPKTFEEKLALVAAGKASIVPAFKPRRVDPDITLGGIATGAL